MLLSFGSSLKILPNAMALNIVPSMDNDEQNYFKKYEKFYKDDTFRETYYNYHKQHHLHHQHHQQQIENEAQQNIGQEQQK